MPLPPEPNDRNKSTGARDQIPPDPSNSRQKMHCSIRRRCLSELITPAISRQTGLRQVFIFRMRETRGPPPKKARAEAPTPPVTPAGSPERKKATQIMRTTAKPPPGVKGATAPPIPPWLPAKCIRPQSSSRRSASSTCASSSPKMRSCGSPLLPVVVRWDGAATTTGDGSSGGLRGGGLRDG
jgi:hypothetical protein